MWYTEDSTKNGKTLKGIINLILCGVWSFISVITQAIYSVPNFILSTLKIINLNHYAMSAISLSWNEFQHRWKTERPLFCNVYPFQFRLGVSMFRRNILFPSWGWHYWWPRFQYLQRDIKMLQTVKLEGLGGKVVLLCGVFRLDVFFYVEEFPLYEKMFIWVRQKFISVLLE